MELTLQGESSFAHVAGWYHPYTVQFQFNWTSRVWMECKNISPLPDFIYFIHLTCICPLLLPNFRYLLEPPSEKVSLF